MLKRNPRAARWLLCCAAALLSIACGITPDWTLRIGLCASGPHRSAPMTTSTTADVRTTALNVGACQGRRWRRFCTVASLAAIRQLRYQDPEQFRPDRDEQRYQPPDCQSHECAGSYSAPKYLSFVGRHFNLPKAWATLPHPTPSEGDGRASNSGRFKTESGSFALLLMSPQDSHTGKAYAY
jgi:hypothetical protein